METQNLIYDGTFDGFLSCVFYYYEFKLNDVTIQSQFHVQSGLFANNQEVVTEEEKSNRVWKGIKSKLGKNATYPFYYAFLSETEGIENLLLDYIKQAFASEKSITTDYANPTVLKVTQIAKMVGREKHRMEAFVRFKLTKDDIYFANIEPDFNVLPLISKHFKNRYADQQWIIYDLKRKYGLFYNLKHVEIIQLELPENFDATKTSEAFFAEEELQFQTLWQNYFKSSNIKSRKNTKLHVRHVPKRYWKYLSEKQV